VRGVYTRKESENDAQAPPRDEASPSEDGESAEEAGELRQVVFVDTPGFHQSERKLNRYLRGLVTTALEDIDAVLYVVDLTRAVGPEEEALAALLAESSCPVFVALNKVDVPEALRREYEVFIRGALPESPVFWTSARESSGVAELGAHLAETMPENALLYPPEFYTDQDPEFRVGEVIREQAIALTREELPHALYVEVSDMEVRKGEPRSTLWIRAFIVVERESQKGIVVGRAGRRIKEIRVASQELLAELFDYRIYLDLRVKVEAKWRRNDTILSRLVH
jgi:GTP-binding protein Era